MTTPVFTWLTLFCAVLLAGCAGPTAERDELAVTKVVLYQNGIGYFERRGEVSGQVLRLRIRPDQINDLLTTLTVLDLSDEGSIASVSLPVEKSASMMLGELPRQVQRKGGLVAVLDAFRGARVDVSAQGGGASGRIVGVEKIKDEPVRWRLTVLASDGTLIPIAVDDIRSVELEDRTLSVGLDKALDVALAEGDWKPIELVVRFPNDRSHDVMMSYVIAMPTWKPAYRLIFNDAGEARLQGWAVVDNLSGEDWNDVQLSLTAGAPISFVVDMHSPRLPRRADLTARTYTDVGEVPPTTVAASRSRRASKPDSKRSEAQEKLYRTEKEISFDEDVIEGQLLLPDSNELAPADMGRALPEDAATGEQVGSLFRYDVKAPVTVPDRSSALVTIVNTDIDAEDVFLYDPSSGSARAEMHPFRAVRLNNTSEFTLEKGPLTIYQSSTFVGEGISTLIAPGQTAFVPYALESGVVVSAAAPDLGASNNRIVSIANGVATVRVEGLAKQTFKIKNNLDTEVAVFVRVNRLGGYELRAPADAIQQGRVFFARVDVPAANEAETTVIQASKGRTSMTLFDPGMVNAIKLYVDDVNANPKVKSQLQAILALQDERSDLARRRRLVLDNRDAYEARVNSLRANIDALGDAASNQALKREQVKLLGEAARKLNALSRELVQLNEQRYGVEVKMKEQFRAIQLEDE